MKTFCSIGLGLLLISCGVGLLFRTQQANALPGNLENFGKIFIVAKYLAPYSMLYYKFMCILLMVSGLFAVINLPYSSNFFITAALMFCIGFDNPLLYTKDEEKRLRYLYILSHVIIYATLVYLTEDPTAVKKRKNSDDDLEPEENTKTKKD
eukprot:TRINITY_DN9492_c0_g1_i9.p1 TRINITY_DN9492_c0_g1~~TRINITY_DN9492_c0_g1_i9.p1  ORF type:complete len:152 (+),score=13.26 TRINITY_DN9492_c0_g1_i9:2-457(+)